MGHPQTKCQASRHTSPGPPQTGGKPGATKYEEGTKYRAPTGESDGLLELILKIEMVVAPAFGIEWGRADRAARFALHVFGNRQLCAACAAQNGFLIPFAPWPNLDGMTCERDMAVFAGIPGGAALHFDGDDVPVRMVVQATRLRIEIQSTDLWSICRCGAAEDRFLFS